MKRSATGSAKRAIERVATWRPKAAGSSPLDVMPLISPLRYDVLVRAEFFRYLRTHPQESLNDLTEHARGTAYFTWFERIAMERFRPWVLKDRSLLQRQFAERVSRSRSLWQSFEAGGFDPRRPMSLRSTSRFQRTDTGAIIGPRLHLADGGHRLALVLARGERLGASMFRIDPRPTSLIDNTATLIRLLSLSSADYTRFVSHAYAPRTFEDIASLRAYVAVNTPDRLEELNSVLHAHGHPQPQGRGGTRPHEVADRRR